VKIFFNLLGIFKKAISKYPHLAMGTVTRYALGLPQGYGIRYTEQPTTENPVFSEQHL